MTDELKPSPEAVAMHIWQAALAAHKRGGHRDAALVIDRALRPATVPGRMVGDELFCDAVVEALKGDHNDLRKEAIILRAHRAAMQPALQAAVDAELQKRIDRLGWPEIHAFRDELRKGQDVREDAGGYWVRAIKALLGFPSRDAVTTYRDAALTILRGATEQGEPTHD